MELSESTFNLKQSLSKLKAIFEWQFKERGLDIYFKPVSTLIAIFWSMKRDYTGA